VSNRIKAQNESIYYNIDALHVAIADCKKASFKYFDFDVDKKRVYRRDGNRYIVNPLALTWDDENYYLITYSEKYENYNYYRVDRMSSIQVEDEPRVSNTMTKSFNVAEYCRSIFSMYDGENVRVKLIADNSIINAMIDRFGKDVIMSRFDEDHVQIIANIKTAGTFFGWLTQFGTNIQIESPDSLRDEYVAFLKNIIKANK
jgi:predicted DNA-binding transcriptional regulator YafY